jgi:hypothetical protein
LGCNATGSNAAQLANPNSGNFPNQPAGYGITAVPGLIPFHGTTGWHSFGSDAACAADPHCSNTNAGIYLNWLATQVSAPISFTLTGNSSLYQTDPTLPPNTNYRAPTNDYGYFLSTNSSNGTSSITINFVTTSACRPSCYAAQFSLYWGSLDAWNSISFQPASGNAITLTGTDLLPILPAGTVLNTNPPNTTSYVLDFSVPLNHYNWTSVTLTSSAPAFEFDNIAWQTSSASCNGWSCTSGGAPVSTPEPSALGLLGSGAVIIVTLIRRRLQI